LEISWDCGELGAELYKRFRNRVHYLVRQAKRRFLDLSLSPKILWKNLDSIGVRDKDFAPADISPDRLNSFFNSSSNVRRPKVQRSTGNFVPLLFAFSNVNSHDVFIAIHRIKAQAYQKKNDNLSFCLFWYAQQQNLYIL
jgi:hypothetical protein